MTSETAAETFKAVADPTRRAILDLLAANDRDVSDLLGHFSISQPALSQHLRVLRDAKLVAPTRDGRRQVYRLIPEGLAEVYDWIAHYTRFWGERLDALGAVLDATPEEQT